MPWGTHERFHLHFYQFPLCQPPHKISFPFLFTDRHRIVLRMQTKERIACPEMPKSICAEQLTRYLFNSQVHTLAGFSPHLLRMRMQELSSCAFYEKAEDTLRISILKIVYSILKTGYPDAAISQQSYRL